MAFEGRKTDPSGAGNAMPSPCLDTWHPWDQFDRVRRDEREPVLGYDELTYPVTTSFGGEKAHTGQRRHHHASKCSVCRLLHQQRSGGHSPDCVDDVLYDNMASDAGVVEP